jgi:hypothetical protein
MQSILDQLSTTLAELPEIGRKLSKDNCDHKMFYLVPEMDIDKTLVQLKSYCPKVSFYKGTSQFQSSRVGWKIAQQGVGIYLRLTQIVEAGLYNFLKKITQQSHLRETEILKAKFSEEKFTPQSMKSNAVIVFYLYIGLLGLSIVIFIKERFWKKTVGKHFENYDDGNVVKQFAL